MKGSFIAIVPNSGSVNNFSGTLGFFFIFFAQQHDIADKNHIASVLKKSRLCEDAKVRRAF